MSPFRQLLKYMNGIREPLLRFNGMITMYSNKLVYRPSPQPRVIDAKSSLGSSNPRRVLAWHRYRHLARLWRQSRISIGDIPLPHHTPTTHKSLPMGFRRLLLLAKIIVFAPITMVIHVVSLFEFSANHLLLLFIIQFCQHFLPRPLETILGPIQ